MKKYLEENVLRDVLYSLLDYLTVIAVDVDILKRVNYHRKRILKNQFKSFVLLVL